MGKKLCIIFLMTCIPLLLWGNSLPFVKEYNTTGKAFTFPGYTIRISSEQLQNEKFVLEEAFQKNNIKPHAEGVVINLIRTDVDLPVKQNKYRDRIYIQGYHLKIRTDSIDIESPSAAGIYYGIQTLLR